MIPRYTNPGIINELETLVVPSAATIRTDAQRGTRRWLDSLGNCSATGPTDESLAESLVGFAYT